MLPRSPPLYLRFLNQLPPLIRPCLFCQNRKWQFIQPYDFCFTHQLTLQMVLLFGFYLSDWASIYLRNHFLIHWSLLLHFFRGEHTRFNVSFNMEYGIILSSAVSGPTVAWWLIIDSEIRSVKVFERNWRFFIHWEELFFSGNSVGISKNTSSFNFLKLRFVSTCFIQSLLNSRQMSPFSISLPRLSIIGFHIMRFKRWCIIPLL